MLIIIFFKVFISILEKAFLSTTITLYFNGSVAVKNSILTFASSGV
ncbi:Uncharacterised protein [Chlamydia trachomatis]|nr:Uncharacterised protein [Chlamydia trachomatis]